MKLHHFDSGGPDKPTIVFLHGFPFNLTTWDDQVELCKPHFRVITYDQRGHGQSEAVNGHYFFEFFVDDLFLLLDALKIEKTILCGLSMGGYVALRAAERHPERVRALILCDTRSEGDSDAAKIKRATDLRLIQDQGLAAFADKFLKAVFAPSTYADQPALVDRIRRMILSTSLEGVQGTLLALATRTDTTASLDSIQVPTLILVGREDAITPPSAAEALRHHIAQSKMVVIPNAGHLSNLENPQVFDAALIDFLKPLRTDL